MTIEEIFSNIITHMKIGVALHNQFAIIFNFLNLNGYKKCHEYHYYEESCNYRNIQNFYIDTYNKIIPSAEVKEIDAIPTNWYRHVRADVDTNTKRSAIKDVMTQWISWEQNTKQLLQESYKELYEQGEIDSALYLSFFIQDVSNELKSAQKKYIDLEASGYDISIIIPEQESLYEKYKEKIKQIYEDDD